MGSSKAPRRASTSDPTLGRRTRPATMQEFWAITEYSTSATVHLADRALQSLEKAELPHLQSVLVQYRWFTGDYPSDLAILVSKLPPSWLRSFAGQLVYEELGSGDPSQAH